jgi:hypothetical protein|tara:strand:+ start:2276 stop:2530 length:255 start_codon:yes stop_codon:yes gene_type:complete
MPKLDQKTDVNMCKREFLFFIWDDHKFSKIDISEDVKIIGKKFGKFETGIFIRKFITTTKYKCKNCGKSKKEVETEEQTIRQYY